MEQVSTQIIEVLNYLGEKFGVTIDWSKDNVLPIIKELCSKYIRWEITTSVVWCIISVIVITITSILGIKSVKKLKNKTYTFLDDEPTFWIAIFSGVVTIAFVIVLCMQLFDIAKYIYFPEMQIYEYVQHIYTNIK